MRVEWPGEANQLIAQRSEVSSRERMQLIEQGWPWHTFHMHTLSNIYLSHTRPLLSVVLDRISLCLSSSPSCRLQLAEDEMDIWHLIGARLHIIKELKGRIATLCSQKYYDMSKWVCFSDFANWTVAHAKGERKQSAYAYMVSALCMSVCLCVVRRV